MISSGEQLIEWAGHLHEGGEPLAGSHPALPAAEELLPRHHSGAPGGTRFGALMLRDQQAARRLRPRRVTPGDALPSPSGEPVCCTGR